jgi:sigma-B regulation protein RsbU (phosphoserine phosphatase)
MANEREWRDELKSVVDLMREMSSMQDPQAASVLYGRRLRESRLLPSDAYMAVSRRGMERPGYRVTRYSEWKEEIDPWKQRDRLPVFSAGLLGELLYSEEPAIVTDLRERVKGDPAEEYLSGYDMLVTMPQYDNGYALNMGVVLVRDGAKFPIERVPVLVWQSNLWGRSVYNLVLRRELDKAYAELDRELKVVGAIQRSLLPAELPVIPGLEMAAHYETSQRAGGDYYDFFPLPDGRVGIVMADVSGHGTPSAVVMAITHAIAHSYPGPAAPPGNLLAYLNRKLAARYTIDGLSGSFVTAFYGIYDPATRVMTYASAGHNAPRLARGGEVRGLGGEAGFPLGIEAGEVYAECEVKMEAGDTLVLYTDGITEAFSPTGELFGTGRLDAILAARPENATAVVMKILEGVGRFTGGSPATDDRTILVLRAT